MDREISASAASNRLGQAVPERNVETADEAAIDSPQALEFSPERLSAAESRVSYGDTFEQVNQLEGRAKVALIRKLLSHLKTEQIQAIIEFGHQELAERQHHPTLPTVAEPRTTCLLLKKDYTYQERGLSEPTQYYVYLRRRKPKLDRYIGTLFYIPNGCALSYFPDAEGRIFFKPPHNVFQLKDSKNPLISQYVRLICLEPPPPDYTFAKQQDDVPDIHLRLEYLDPNTFQPLAEESYQFPFCMYEGGKLDRYRWEVSAAALPTHITVSESVTPPPKIQVDIERDRSSSKPTSPPHESAVQEPLASTQLDSTLSSPASGRLSATPNVSSQHDLLAKKKDVRTKSPRRIIELPENISTFYIEDHAHAAIILERMRLWVSWSEKAMPQARWEIVQDKDIYTIRNVNFKRKLLSFSPEQGALTLATSVPVIVKCFQDLSLAVSQTQNQRQYSAAQLKLARSLFVDMSLPQSNPLTILKQLFGVKFVKAS
jgi:hypothetical protein